MKEKLEKEKQLNQNISSEQLDDDSSSSSYEEYEDSQSDEDEESADNHQGMDEKEKKKFKKLKKKENTFKNKMLKLYSLKDKIFWFIDILQYIMTLSLFYCLINLYV